jgi:hypothetical protein
VYPDSELQITSAVVPSWPRRRWQDLEERIAGDDEDAAGIKRGAVRRDPHDLHA